MSKIKGIILSVVIVFSFCLFGTKVSGEVYENCRCENEECLYSSVNGEPTTRNSRNRINGRRRDVTETDEVNQSRGEANNGGRGIGNRERGGNRSNRGLGSSRNDNRGNRNVDGRFYNEECPYYIDEEKE